MPCNIGCELLRTLSYASSGIPVFDFHDHWNTPIQSRYGKLKPTALITSALFLAHFLRQPFRIKTGTFGDRYVAEIGAEILLINIIYIRLISLAIHEGCMRIHCRNQQGKASFPRFNVFKPSS